MEDFFLEPVKVAGHDLIPYKYTTYFLNFKLGSILEHNYAVLK